MLSSSLPSTKPKSPPSETASPEPSSSLIKVPENVISSKTKSPSIFKVPSTSKIPPDEILTVVVLPNEYCPTKLLDPVNFTKSDLDAPSRVNASPTVKLSALTNSTPSPFEFTFTIASAAESKSEGVSSKDTKEPEIDAALLTQSVVSKELSSPLTRVRTKLFSEAVGTVFTIKLPSISKLALGKGVPIPIFSLSASTTNKFSETIKLPFTIRSVAISPTPVILVKTPSSKSIFLIEESAICNDSIEASCIKL